jgi:hypothetical protein
MRSISLRLEWAGTGTLDLHVPLSSLRHDTIFCSISWEPTTDKDAHVRQQPVQYAQYQSPPGMGGHGYVATPDGGAGYAWYANQAGPVYPREHPCRLWLRHDTIFCSISWEPTTDKDAHEDTPVRLDWHTKHSVVGSQLMEQNMVSCLRELSGTCKSSDQVSRSKSKKVCLGCAGKVVPAGLAGSLGSVARETQAEVLVLFEHMPRG